MSLRLGCVLACLLAPACLMGMPDAWVSYYTLYGTNTIYLYNNGTNEMRRVFASGSINPTAPAFSLDGKQLALLRKKDSDTGSIFIINNDGTGLRRVCATFARTTQHYNGTSTMCWTQQGLFWSENSRSIYWADPRTGESKVVGTLATSTTGNLLSMSRDGTRAYLRTDHTTAAAVGGLFFEVGAGVSGMLNERPFPNPLWDHGSTMLQDGSAALWVVWECGSYGNPPGCGGHRRFAVRNFTNMTQWSLVAPPDPDTTQLSGPAGGPYSTPSSPDHFLYRKGGWDNYTCTVFNYKTGEWIDVTPRPIAPGGPIDTLPRLSLQGGFWLGDLPNPHDSTPNISLNRSMVSLTALTAAAGPDTVVVTNTGIGTLSAVTVSESPAAAWLSVQVSGSGNTQQLVVRVDTAGLARGDYQCVVTVSGGGAPNTAAFAVRLSVGSALLPPTGLAFDLLGDTWTELDAALRWTDNTTAEAGFVLQRRTGAAAFAGLASLSANTTALTDTTIVRGTTYDYRLRAFSGTDSSAWSETLSVAVPATPIVVTSPQQGESWALDQPQHIRWTAPSITTVQIEYSVSEGESWVLITAAGGVSQGSANWGDYVWTVPASLGSQPSVLIRVAQYQNLGIAGFSGAFSLTTSSSTRPQRLGGRQPGLRGLQLYDMLGRALAPGRRAGHSGAVFVARMSSLDPASGRVTDVGTCVVNGVR